MIRRLPFSIILLSICLLVSACTKPGELQTATPDSRYYAVDPVFREFYNFLGGKAVLGEVISPASDAEVTTQYTVAGLLIFDPQAVPMMRFQLGSLGKDFGIPEGENAEIRVGEPFQALYDRLGGAAFVGKPLTEMAYNQEKNRTEQYFENLGFYQGPETEGHVRLLPYGAWSCGEDCRNSLPVNAAPLAQEPTRPQEKPAEPTAEITLPTPQESAEPAPASSPQAEAPAVIEPSSPVESHRWVIKVTEDSSVVGSDQAQIIRIFLKQDGEPFSDAAADLFVTLPDGSEHQMTFPATNANGMATLAIDPIQAENGTGIPYQVCISAAGGNTYCVQGNYTIWTTR